MAFSDMRQKLRTNGLEHGWRNLSVNIFGIKKHFEHRVEKRLSLCCDLCIVWWERYTLLCFICRDRLCGMLQCTNIKDVDLPVIGTERSAYYHYYGPTLCKLV